MTTGTAVINQVNARLPANAIYTDTEKLSAVNAAILNGWPRIVDVGVDSSVTLVSTTYEYTPTELPELEQGYAHAYITRTGQPKVFLRRVTQRRDATVWTIHVPPDITLELTGQVLHLQYYKTHSEITALTDTINMPLDYLWKYTTSILCLTGLAKVGDFDRSAYEKLATQYERMAEQAKMSHAVQMDRSIKQTTEQGSYTAAISVGGIRVYP